MDNIPEARYTLTSKNTSLLDWKRQLEKPNVNEHVKWTDFCNTVMNLVDKKKIREREREKIMFDQLFIWLRIGSDGFKHSCEHLGSVKGAKGCYKMKLVSVDVRWDLPSDTFQM